MGKTPANVKTETLAAVEDEVDQLRERTQALIEELERRVQTRVDQARDTVDRVKHAVDLPAQVREHPRAAAGVGAGTAFAVGLGVWLLVRNRRYAHRPSVIARRRARALRQLLIDPERALQHGEPLGKKVLGAIVASAATVLARMMVQRFAYRMIDAPRREPSGYLPPRMEDTAPRA